MNASPIALCLHCESAPQEHYLRLCRQCAASVGIRRLYKRTRHWTAAWDAHLQRLTARAQARLPLFPTLAERLLEESHEKAQEVRPA